MLSWIKRGWKAYTDWCDRMGLTPENRRCCAPRLEEPELASKRARHSGAEHSGMSHVTVASDECLTKNTAKSDRSSE
ncbi:Transposase [Shewanella amazonensis]|uniref:Uncharacterized protein n=1 Tax=Shewanella amazonensis (strain ATCC BAA-1098 / SB2B) TaxID=326297 RepID=A1S470_SHEAM|nr:hypothetical protein Sama_0969 [Shewanella amazonensis SB2B]